MKIVYIMQGIPGSGKSTRAREIRAQTAGSIISTDDFWYEVTENGSTYRGDTYQFDASRLGEAHDWNQRRCRYLMDGEYSTPTIIVDNTNIRQAHAQPYIDLAKRYGYEVQVVRVDTDVETCIARQADRPEDRRVPDEVIRKMAASMEDLSA